MRRMCHHLKWRCLSEVVASDNTVTRRWRRGDFLKEDLFVFSYKIGSSVLVWLLVLVEILLILYLFNEEGACGINHSTNVQFPQKLSTRKKQKLFYLMILLMLGSV
ncbi:hypothetical protein FCM35_KLT04148 [Carex littledalei]|uniref:Uncharacterized protein n=1 Tax=Carex littledalei TaxID=544730 RepID=A0A833VQ32_9POAL|nr:hypothetical protein FCM35_KLT04148 [Carex littledalei]